jgi:hypothetical protein
VVHTSNACHGVPVVGVPYVFTPDSVLFVTSNTYSSAAWVEVQALVQVEFTDFRSHRPGFDPGFVYHGRLYLATFIEAIEWAGRINNQAIVLAIVDAFFGYVDIAIVVVPESGNGGCLLKVDTPDWSLVS